jgi:hypothetical protein
MGDQLIAANKKVQNQGNECYIATDTKALKKEK